MDTLTATQDLCASVLENPFYRCGELGYGEEALVHLLHEQGCDAETVLQEPPDVPMRTRQYEERHLYGVPVETGGRERVAENGTRWRLRACPGIDSEACCGSECNGYPGPGYSLVECLDEGEMIRATKTGQLPTNPRPCVLCSRLLIYKLISYVKADPNACYAQPYWNKCDAEEYAEEDLLLPTDENGLSLPVVNYTKFRYVWGLYPDYVLTPVKVDSKYSLARTMLSFMIRTKDKHALFGPWDASLDSDSSKRLLLFRLHHMSVFSEQARPSCVKYWIGVYMDQLIASAQMKTPCDPDDVIPLCEDTIPMDRHNANEIAFGSDSDNPFISILQKMLRGVVPINKISNVIEHPDTLCALKMTILGNYYRSGFRAPMKVRAAVAKWTHWKEMANVALYAVAEYLCSVMRPFGSLTHVTVSMDWTTFKKITSRVCDMGIRRTLYDTGKDRIDPVHLSGAVGRGYRVVYVQTPAKRVDTALKKLTSYRNKITAGGEVHDAAHEATSEADLRATSSKAKKTAVKRSARLRYDQLKRPRLTDIATASVSLDAMEALDSHPDLREEEKEIARSIYDTGNLPNAPMSEKTVRSLSGFFGSVSDKTSMHLRPLSKRHKDFQAAFPLTEYHVCLNCHRHDMRIVVKDNKAPTSKPFQLSARHDYQPICTFCPNNPPVQKVNLVGNSFTFGMKKKVTVAMCCMDAQVTTMDKACHTHPKYPLLCPMCTKKAFSEEEQLIMELEKSLDS